MGWLGNNEIGGRVGTTQKGLFIFVYYFLRFSTILFYEANYPHTHTRLCAAQHSLTSHLALISPLVSLLPLTETQNALEKSCIGVCPYHLFFLAPPSILKPALDRAYAQVFMSKSAMKLVSQSAWPCIIPTKRSHSYPVMASVPLPSSSTTI